MTYSLTLHPRVNITTSDSATAYLTDLTSVAHGWRRSSRATGGWWLGSFSLSQEDLTRAELQEFYNLNIGCKLAERTYGIRTWGGFIVEMRYRQSGSEYMMSLWPQWFHNRVRVSYSDAIGSLQQTDDADNDDSITEFGRCEWIENGSSLTTAGAESLRDRILTEYAWPRSRETGSVSLTGHDVDSGPDILEVYVAGYWATLNWRYRYTTTTDAASDLITTLVGESEFVSAGRIESNTDVYRVDCEHIPRRTGDLIEEIVEQGDSSGNQWKGGVLNGRLFEYEQAPALARYTRRGGQLLEITGNPVEPTMMNGGFLVYNAEAPSGWVHAGVSTDWDDPRVRYVEEVEFIAGENDNPDELVLTYQDADTLRLGEKDTLSDVRAIYAWFGDLFTETSSFGATLLPSQYGGGQLVDAFMANSLQNYGAGAAAGAHWSGTNIAAADYGVTANGAVYVDLDGSTEYISIADATWQEPASEEFFTWQWVRTTTVASTQTIKSKYLEAGDQRGWDLWFDSATGYFAFTANAVGALVNDVSVTSTLTVAVDTWYFVAAYFEPSTLLRIFVGAPTAGSLTVTSVTASVPASIYNGTADLCIGAALSAAATPTAMWSGRISNGASWKNIANTYINNYANRIFKLTRRFYTA